MESNDSTKATESHRETLIVDAGVQTQAAPENRHILD